MTDLTTASFYLVLRVHVRGHEQAIPPRTCLESFGPGYNGIPCERTSRLSAPIECYATLLGG